MAWRRWRDISIATVALLCLGLATLPWIGKLGMEYDEAHFLTHAVKIANGAEEVIHLPYGITVAHRPLPLMTMPYVGSLDAFIYAIPYRIFGTSPVVSRLTNLLLGVLIFGLTYLIVRREAGVSAGAIAMGLLLTDVELILHLTMNYGPILLQQAFTMGAIVCLQKWWKGATGGYFFGAVALMALAFHEKLTYIWILGPLGAGIAIFYGKRSWARSRWWYWPTALALALAIVSPIVYFAFSSPEIFGFGKQSTHLPTDWRPLLLERWRGFDLMLRGSGALGFAEAPPPEEIARGYWLHILFAAGLVAATIRRQRMALLLYTTAIGVWCANLLFPDAGRMHHLLLMAPLWQAGAAIGIATAGRVSRYAACAVLLLAGLDAARSYEWFSTAVARTGGMYHWSDMTVGAARWLEAHPELEAATPSWGISRPVFVLSGGKSVVFERYFESMASPLAGESKVELTALVHRQKLVWLVSDVMPVYEDQWQRVAGLSKHRPVLVAEFPARNGRFHIRAYRFDLPERPIVKWQPQGSLEFALLTNWDTIRFSLDGIADKDSEGVSVEWLDDKGARLWIDRRPMGWVPHLSATSHFDFGRDFWPRSFSRTREHEGEAVRVRIDATLERARIEKPEIGLR